MKWWIILIIILILIVIYIVSIYNKLVRLKNSMEDQWAQIDVYIKKRIDLIPNLIETVKGYAKHEKSTFEAVIKARNAFASANSVSDEIDANNQISGALNKLFALSEAYPELKANENFSSLQKELNNIESSIASARQFYNDAVLTYNNAVGTVPSNIIANLFGFKEAKFIKVENEEERKAPKVSF